MYMEKLEHFFPEPAIRELDRCHYKVPKGDLKFTELLEDLEAMKIKIE